MSSVNEQMVIGRCDVNGPRLERLLVLDVNNAQRRHVLEETRKQIVRMSAPVLNYRHRDWEFRWQILHELTQGSQAAPRRADDGDGNIRHRTFRKIFSGPLIRS